MIAYTPEQIEAFKLAHQKAREEEAHVESRIRQCEYVSSSLWDKQDDKYPNAIYIGRALLDSDNKYAYYIGQSRRPVQRWRQHMDSGTGCVPYGDDIEWAILTWDIPYEAMDVAESYLIGYVLAVHGCINGNRGKSERAFQRGYSDGVKGEVPQVCQPIDMGTLLWRNVGGGGDIGKYIDLPKGDHDIWDRRWGFHLVVHDAEKVISAKLASREEDLSSKEHDLWRKEQDFINERKSHRSLPYTMFFLGALCGFIATMLVMASRLK